MESFPQPRRQKTEPEDIASLSSLHLNQNFKILQNQFECHLHLEKTSPPYHHRFTYCGPSPCHSQFILVPDSLEV
jgi:hypothetical protein